MTFLRVKALIGWLTMAAMSTAPPVSAENAFQLGIDASPLIYVRDGRVHGCGVRLTGGEVFAARSFWFDVSVNLFRHGIGLVQAIAFEIRPSIDTPEGRPVIAPLESAWVQVSEAGARRGENVERQKSLIYTVLLDDVLATFEAVAEGRAVKLGIKRWNQTADIVYTAAPALSADSRDGIGRCLAALAGG